MTACLVVLACLLCGSLAGQQAPYSELKRSGAARSRYLTEGSTRVPTTAPEPRLDEFRRAIRPVLAKSCFGCHGPEEQEADLRIDRLDPDLFEGDDVDWWLEVLSVLTNGEMPPEDEGELSDERRARVIEWLSKEVQAASTARRSSGKHTSFRRMARYEYGYALQDLLGLPYDFAQDLPPDPASEHGFQNSSELLHLTGMQFRAYLNSARKALRAATVVGDPPQPLHWGVSMAAAAAKEWAKQDQRRDQLRRKHKQNPAKLKAMLSRHDRQTRVRPNAVHYLSKSSGRAASQAWAYNGAKYAWAPTESKPEPPGASDVVAVVPRGRSLIVELGDRIPEDGTLRVRVRASRGAEADAVAPSMQLIFGWKASNDSQANVRVSGPDLVVDATPDAPSFYEWNIPLYPVYPRNSVRKRSKMGDLPSPSEYLKIVNASVSKSDLHIDYVEVAAPVHEQWPPTSHRRLFLPRNESASDRDYVRRLVAEFMPRAWRREVTTAEIEQKVRLFENLRPTCASLQAAMIEVFASVLASPHFLYVVQADSEVGLGLSDTELSTRLALFLWCSVPDNELRVLAASGQLSAPDVFRRQIERMLADPKARRLSRQFVRQWLGLELLDYLHVDRKAHPRFRPALRGAMGEEPIAFFDEVLAGNLSALEFLHADFTMANELLAKHYGLRGVRGNGFRRVALDAGSHRGGLLTQAGLLAMNSDGKDSHPLKRGIWMLERLLDDPPPPPPPAVPEIDLADPEIAKMTLKQRIENHRNDPACLSCHVKIDPWGIAFENFDALGQWRTEVQGRPVDSVGVLFNQQKLDGIDGLKRFLLTNRQDQFVRALVHKLATFALGRPLAFEDRAAIDEITARVRKRGDGLATMVTEIATSTLFRSR